MIVHAEALAWLRGQPDNSFDAFFADPPYGLSPDGRARDWDQIAAMRDGKKRRGFMSRAWDAGVPGPTFWRQVLRVLKPGAPILAFGGTRTYHRMVCALEDAGAEIVDCLSWLYGQGFPKSYDVSKGIDAAALFGKANSHGIKLAHNARAPDEKAKRRRVSKDGDFGRNSAIAAGYKTAATEIRDGYQKSLPTTPDAKRWDGYGTALRPSWEPCVLACKPFEGTIVANALKWGVGGLWIEACRLPREIAVVSGPALSGGWPANVMLDEAAARMLDEQSGELKASNTGGNGSRGAGFMSSRAGKSLPVASYSDSGGASRFMYCAKVSKWEREFGCDELPLRSPGEAVDREEGTAGIGNARAGAGRTGDGVRNPHPCLKPIALTQWLATLILPPPRETPRRLLNIFAGSGSEAIGAIRAGWDEIVSVEREAEYVPALEARIARWSQIPVDMSVEQVRATSEVPDPRQSSLFDMTGTK